MSFKEKPIFVAGATGMVGGAIVRNLTESGYKDLVVPTSKDVDLRIQVAVENFFFETRPALVVLAAARVGGIQANNVYRADFIYENLMIEANVIHSAYKAGVEKLIFLGSSCIYPRLSKQPISEEELLTGSLEPTNEPYAIAKIAGVKLCESYFRQYDANFFSAMPTNLYGIHDNFDLETSHVIPALIRKFDDAVRRGEGQVSIWGTGKPRREFMYADDLADAIRFLIENVDASNLALDGVSHVNIGTGEDIEIGELAEIIGRIVGFRGEVIYDHSKPDGTPRKLLDISRIKKLGWEPKTSLEKGLRLAVEWYRRSFSAAA